MKSFKTYLTLTALVFSVSVLADRSRDSGYHNKDNHARHAQKHNNKQQHNPGFKGQHSARSQARSNKNHRAPTYNERAYRNSDKRYQPHAGFNKHVQRGSGNKHHNHHNAFNGDYRDNRHFDNRNYHQNSRPYRNQRHFGYHNRHNNHFYHNGYIRHNYYKPKKHYKKWKRQLRKHQRWIRNNHRHLYHYNAYYDDVYRFRPLRGLGHYFDRPGFGYGHWHEGWWCRDYHDVRFYQDYYTYYPYHDGWRHGDGDFGIWFSFNL